MKFAVVGSRSVTDPNIIKDILLHYHITTLVSGGAKGVDAIAELYANENDIKTEIYRPDYKTHGRAAPFVRNTLIIENAEIVVSIWDGKSTGTKDSMNKAKKLNKSMDVWLVKEDGTFTLI